MFSSNELINLLQESGDSDILKSDVAKLLYDMNKQKVINIHKNTITKPKGEKSRWSTYVKGDNNKRIKITSTTEDGLFNKLNEFYFVKRATTLESLFPEWIEKRRECGTSSSTIHRNINDWDKFYRDNKIIKIPIQNITVEQIESFFNSSITSFHLKAKALGNMKMIMKELFKLAFKRKLITYNPMNDVDIYTQACEPPRKHNDTSRVYLPDEREKLFNELNRELSQFPNKTDTHAVFLLFKLGLRLGELVALKWSDIDFQNREIHINRIESKDDNESGNLVPTIVEHTKKKSFSGNRYLPLDDYDIEILEKISSINKRCCYKESEFVFCDENGRTNKRSIDNLIRKCCKRANIEIKSAHDIRRTVASEMFANGVSVEVIKNYLGHSDIQTTFGYILDNQSKEERNRKIEKSLNNMNGFIRTQTYSYI